MISPEPFSIGSERTGALHRLTPHGELDIATAPALRHEIEPVLDDATVEKIVVDLTELAFLDSSGIRLLLEISEICQPADRLRVVNGSPAVVRAIDIAGVRPLLPIITSTDDPYAALPPQAPSGPV